MKSNCYLLKSILLVCVMNLPSVSLFAQALSNSMSMPGTMPPANGTGMVDLPALPVVNKTTGDESLDKVMNDALALQEKAQQSDDEKLKNLIPWRDGFGDPRDRNFQNLLKNQFPMSPEQIKTFRETLNIYEKAMQEQVRNPTPIMSTRSVNLDPGSAPPAVKISTGYVSSIIFVDDTGAPWPIRAYDIGNPEAFSIVWEKGQPSVVEDVAGSTVPVVKKKNFGSNILLIQGLLPYSNTNLVVMLDSLSTPVIINLVNDQQKVDYRLDLRIPGMGPLATVPIMANASIPGTDTMLMGLIDGIPPEQARPLEVFGGNAQAWLLNDEELLIRTRLTILSPSYTGSMRSPDGTKVYRMPKTPIIMAAKDGNTYKLAINGY